MEIFNHVLIVLGLSVFYLAWVLCLAVVAALPAICLLVATKILFRTVRLAHHEMCASVHLRKQIEQIKLRAKELQFAWHSRGAVELCACVGSDGGQYKAVFHARSPGRSWSYVQAGDSASDALSKLYWKRLFKSQAPLPSCGAHECPIWRECPNRKKNSPYREIFRIPTSPFYVKANAA